MPSAWAALQSTRCLRSSPIFARSIFSTASAREAPAWAATRPLLNNNASKNAAPSRLFPIIVDSRQIDIRLWRHVFNVPVPQSQGKALCKRAATIFGSSLFYTSHRLGRQRRPWRLLKRDRDQQARNMSVLYPREPDAQSES